MSTSEKYSTEVLRRQQVIEVNSSPVPEGSMTTDEMQKLYEVVGFAAPYVVVKRKSDGQRGTLTFTHNPRRYFDFTAV